MHGNLHAPREHLDLNREPGNSSIALWLGLPAARDEFNVSALSAEDRARFDAIRSPQRRADFAVSRALRAFVELDDRGYSASHSGGHAALLLGPADMRLGVDLEVVQPRDVLRIARFAFDTREIDALESCSAETRMQWFYTMWTLKESFAKALQLNLVDAVRRCVFWPRAGSWAACVPTREAWSAVAFQPRPGLFIAVAFIGEREFPPLQPWEWPPRQRAEWPIIAVYQGAPAKADALRA